MARSRKSVKHLSAWVSDRYRERFARAQAPTDLQEPVPWGRGVGLFEAHRSHYNKRVVAKWRRRRARQEIREALGY